MSTTVSSDSKRPASRTPTSHSEPSPLWMLNTNSSDSASGFNDDGVENRSPTLARSYSNISALSSTGGRSIASESSYKSKYEPLHSIHTDIQDVFLRPRRQLKSRGHEIPEPAFRVPAASGGGSVVGRAVSRGSKRFDTSSRNNANVQARPHTSGTTLPHGYSPIRPSERSKNLYSRATSPVMMRHGHVISRDIFGRKYPYPLNAISYERSSAVCHDMQNSSMPDGAESILSDNRFSSIAPFITKQFYNSMSSNQMMELAEKRKRKKLVTKKFPNVPAMMSIDYEKRGSPGAVKRQVHRQIFS